MAKDYRGTAIDYANGVVNGEIIAGEDVINACRRFLKDLQREDIELRMHDPNLAIGIMEKTLVHKQGETLDGQPLMGKPLILEPFQVFIVVNLLGWYYKGTNIRRFKEAFIMLARKNGKALSLDTQIPTPDGWKKMGDVHPGSYVYGRDGQPVKVLIESEIFHKQMYRVTFEDGSSVKASADHIWTVKTKATARTARRPLKDPKRWFINHEARDNDGFVDRTTSELAGDYAKVRKDGKGIEYKYRVPAAGPVAYSEQNLPVDPYTFGVWLGDGTSVAAKMTCGEDDLQEMISILEGEGHRCAVRRHEGKAPTISLDKKEHGKHNELLDGLRAAGVYANKHIPDVYLRSSIEQRWALLQGLMDTDGTVSKAGQCEFTQKSEQLSRDVLELIRSLGIKASMKEKQAICNGKDAGTVYRINFYTDAQHPCFRLSRKRARLKERLANRANAKSIVKIEEIETEPSKCIAVDSPDHLYLCSEGFTATHNTTLIAGIAWAVGIIQRKSGSVIYMVANALKQTLQAFNFLKFSIEYRKLDQTFDIKDNSFEHSIKYQFRKPDGTPDGTLEIQAMPANPDRQDSFNSNFTIADEVAAYKNPAQYNRFKEAGKAYTNKMIVGITTAGDNMNSFGYNRMIYAVNVAKGVIEDDSLFSFVARADQDEKGNVDYLNPIQHQKANPNYGVTIRPEDMMADAYQAQNDPQQRKDFLSRSLNVYTAAMRSWFDIEEFRKSDRQYNWTMEELAKLPIYWYGGADLSRTYDLTAGALFGQYGDVDIIITHGFFPVTQAAAKQDEDQIPIYGWKDDGWLTICNGATVNISDIVNWFIEMRNQGFRIAQVGHDRKFAGEEFIPQMKAAGFNTVDQPQLFYLKSRGFRHIEKAAKDGMLYYLHSTAYEYCVSNVMAIEKTDDAVSYHKIDAKSRMDLFDASVFACIRCLEDGDKQARIGGWFD